MLRWGKSKFLIIYSIAIVPVMIITFFILTSLLGKTIGYISSYALYLVILLSGITLARQKYVKKEYLKPRHRCLYYTIAFVPVIATFCVAFLPIINKLTVPLVMITAVYSLINATLEEFFWRYTYNRVYSTNVVLAYIIPTIIFSCWHFALLFAKDMSYHGGALALVGGATFMGFLWGLVMFKTQNVKVVITAYVLSNFFAFSQLIYQNWFAK